MSENPCNSPFSQQSKPRFAENSAAKPTWTTRRCNHLLRSLSSRLKDLRKAQQESIPVTGEAGTRSNQRPSSTSDSILANSKCPDWASSPVPPKKIRRTYSAREAGSGLQRRPVHLEAGGPENEPSLRIPSNSSGTYHQSLLGEFLKKMGLDSGTSDNKSLIATTAATTATTSRGEIFSSKKAPAQDFLPNCLKVSDPKRWKLIDGIFMALIALLKATSNHETTTPIGSRSLFSTCLRKTSDYIAAEELRLKEEDPENTVDISTNIYNDLEAIGSSLAGGWTPLREVVRAHGISMLGNAVKDGLLDPVVARGLTRICLHHGAVDEGQQIMECMLSTLKSIERPANIRSSLLGSSSMGTLDNFACMSRRYGFQYRELTKLFREGILPIEWMATNDMIPCWNRLMLSLTEGKENTRDAEMLLRTVLSMSFRVPYKSLPSRMHNIRLRARDISCTSSSQPSFPSKTRKAIQPAKQKRLPDEDDVEDMDHALRTTSLHLLAILSAINCLRSSASSNDSSKVNIPVLQDIVLEVHQAFDVWQNDYSSGGTAPFLPDTDLICLPLLAAGLVYARIGKDQVDVNQRIYPHFDILKHWKPSPEFADTAAMFLCLVINHCEQVSSIDAFQYLQEFVQSLTQSHLFPDIVPETQRLFREIAATAAIKWTKRTNIPKHLTWALDLESSINRMTMGADLQTPSRASVFERFISKTKSGFSWEEGICEWVAGTPVIPTPKLDLVLDGTKIASKWDEGVLESDAGTPPISIAKPAVHKQRHNTGSVLDKTKNGFKKNEGVWKSVTEIPVFSVSKPAMHMQQEKINVVLSTATAVTLVSTKPAPCLVEVSSGSLKFNGIAKIAEVSFPSIEKYACATFSRVEIDHSRRNNSGKVQERAKISSNTTETRQAKVVPSQSSKVDTVVLSKKTPEGDAQTLDTRSSHTEARNTRNQSQRHSSCKRKASPISSRQRRAESARIKRQKQLAEQESEDELSLS